MHKRFLIHSKAAVAILVAMTGILSATTVVKAQSGPHQVVEQQLKNGLKVLVWPDDDIPNAAMYIWYRVGSRNEAPGITGVSHFFEHMMFNGAKKYGPGEFDRVMEAKGGSNNAFTSTDVTVYQNWFPVEAIRTIFELEADRIGSLAIDPKMVESERGVVYSERRTSVDNNNESLLDESVRSVAFVAHPYGIPTIGWPSDIESWTIDDLRSHFKTYYAPNNAVLILSGAVTPKDAISMTQKYLGPIKAQKPPKEIRTEEPVQLGERRITLHRPAQLAIVQVVYRAPAAVDPNFDALEILESVLLSGESSRLYRRLVDKEQIALDVKGGVDAGFDPGLFSFTVTVAQGADPTRVETVLKEELANVVMKGITPEELQKAKTLQIAEYYRILQTIDGRAYALGHYEMFRGGWRKLFDVPQAVENVTTDAVGNVAKQVFDPSAATVGWLIPTKEEAQDAHVP
ncbi:MAG: insulinase family protein [Myxococcales bacterium]|nr:insulinase family protein [Myxococcales bacterium]